MVNLIFAALVFSIIYKVYNKLFVEGRGVVYILGGDLVLQALVSRSMEGGLNKCTFFFARWYFDSIKRHGNTHYCFHCGGAVGFRPGPNGEAMNSVDDTHVITYDPMAKHDKTHASAILGEIQQYHYIGDWLRWVRAPKDFPYIVAVNGR